MYSFPDDASFARARRIDWSPDVLLSHLTETAKSDPRCKMIFAGETAYVAVSMSETCVAQRLVNYLRHDFVPLGIVTHNVGLLLPQHELAGLRDWAGRLLESVVWIECNDGYDGPFPDPDYVSPLSSEENNFLTDLYSLRDTRGDR